MDKRRIEEKDRIQFGCEVKERDGRVRRNVTEAYLGAHNAPPPRTGEKTSSGFLKLKEELCFRFESVSNFQVSHHSSHPRYNNC